MVTRLGGGKAHCPAFLSWLVASKSLSSEWLQNCLTFQSKNESRESESCQSPTRTLWFCCPGTLLGIPPDKAAILYDNIYGEKVTNELELAFPSFLELQCQTMNFQGHLETLKGRESQDTEPARNSWPQSSEPLVLCPGARWPDGRPPLEQVSDVSPSKSAKALTLTWEGQTQSPRQGSLCSLRKGDRFLSLFLSLVAVFGQGRQGIGHCESP